MDINTELESGTFHIRMLKYIQVSLTQEEWDNLKDDEHLNLEFEEFGVYSLPFLQLKELADTETLALLDKYKDLVEESKTFKLEEDEKDSN